MKNCFQSRVIRGKAGNDGQPVGNPERSRLFQKLTVIPRRGYRSDQQKMAFRIVRKQIQQDLLVFLIIDS